MKVRLIQPSHFDRNGKIVKFGKLWFPNLTLPTVAALTPRDVEVGITTEYVEDIDFDESVDLVGVTGQTCQAPRAYQIADEFRKRGRKTIMGGIHASACADEALQHFDSVLVGEAENLWEQVIADAGTNNLQRLYKAEEKPDLAKLAIPRYDLLDMKHYVIPPFARTPLMQIQTTRGCPHDCNFCSVSRFFGHRIRSKPIRNVIAEIEAIRPSRIFFTDDNIIADPVYAKRLFEALKPLKTRWACQLSTKILKHPDLIDAAAESGCHETFTGLESLDEQNLLSVNKGFNKIGEYKALFERLAQVGILAHVSVITGLDHDTPESLVRMAEVLSDWHINYLYIATITPYPGTPIRERFMEEGRLLTSDWSKYDMFTAIVRPKNMTPEEQEEALWKMHEVFYSRRNSFRRFMRFGRQYLRYFPRDNAIEELFFHAHVMKAVKKRTHPFTMGETVD